MDLLTSYAYLGKYKISEKLLNKIKIVYSLLIIANYFKDDQTNLFLNSSFMQKIKDFFIRAQQEHS